MGELGIIINLNIIRATIRMATPIAFAAMGLVITEQAAITNIGIEGIMLMGAFIAVAVSYFTGSWVLGMLAAIIAGVIVSLLMAVIHLRFKADVFVAGIAINLFSLAFTRFLLRNIFHTAGSFYSPEIVPIPNLEIPVIKDIPVINTLINGFALTDYLAVMIVFLVFILLYKTVWGLRLRFVGIHPLSAETGGINVNARKYQAMIISGVLGGLAGAHLSLGYTTQFIENMTNGRGFIGVAAMYFGGVTPVKTWLASLFFGFTEALGNNLQTLGLPSQFMLMIPYIATVIAITIGMVRQYRKNSSRDIFK